MEEEEDFLRNCEEGGGELLNQSQEATPTRCRMGSSPMEGIAPENCYTMRLP